MMALDELAAEGALLKQKRQLERRNWGWGVGIEHLVRFSSLETKRQLKLERHKLLGKNGEHLFCSPTRLLLFYL